MKDQGQQVERKRANLRQVGGQGEKIVLSLAGSHNDLKSRICMVKRWLAALGKRHIGRLVCLMREILIPSIFYSRPTGIIVGEARKFDGYVLEMKKEVNCVPSPMTFARRNPHK